MKQEKDMRASDIHAEPVSPIGVNEVPGWRPQGPTDHTCPMPPTPSSDALPGFTPQYTHQFRFWCQHILPLVYEQSLSYYEVLCKIASKLNEVIQSENALNENMVAAVNKVNELIEKFNTFIIEVKSFLDCFEARMDAVEQRMDAVETELQVFETRINSEMQAFETRIQAIVDQYTALVQQLQTQVQNLTTLVNSFDGRITTNTTNIASLRSDLTALTARVQANETWIQNFKHEKYGYYDVTQGDDPFVGDGTETDTLKLKQILNAHSSVYFPRKDTAYKIVTTKFPIQSGLSILSDSDIEFTGGGDPTEIRESLIFSKGRIKKTGTASVTLKDCRLFCGANGTILKNCFVFSRGYSVSNCEVENCVLFCPVFSVTVSGDNNLLSSKLSATNSFQNVKFLGCDTSEDFSAVLTGRSSFIDCTLSKGKSYPTARISVDGAESVTFQNCELGGKIVLNNIGKRAVLENCNADGMELDSSMSRITVENCLFENSKTDFESCRVNVTRSNLSAYSGNTNLWNDCEETKISGSTVSGMQIRGQQGNTDRFVIVDSVVDKADFGWHVEAEGSQIEIVSGTAIAGKYKNCLLKGDPSNFSGGSYHDCGFVFQTIPVTAMADSTSVFEHCVDKSVRNPVLYDNRIPNLNGLTGNAKIEKETVQAGDRVGWKSTSTTGTHEPIRNFNDRYSGVSLRKIYPAEDGSDARLIPLNSMFSVLVQNLNGGSAYSRLLFSSNPVDQSKYVIADFIPYLAYQRDAAGLTINNTFQNVSVVGYALHLCMQMTATNSLVAGTKLFTINGIPDDSPYQKTGFTIGGFIYGASTPMKFAYFYKIANTKYVTCSEEIPAGASAYICGSDSVNLTQYPVPETTNFLIQ